MGINIELPVSGGGGVSIGDAIGGASANQILITDGSGNLSERPNILTSTGGGSNFLADDGTYKAVSASIAIGDAVGGSIANTLLYVNGSLNLANSNRLVYDGTYFYHTGPYTSSGLSTRMGYLCGASNTSTTSTFYGYRCGGSTNSARNVAYGVEALSSSTGTSENVAVGNDAGYGSSGIRGVFVGYRAGRGNSGSGCMGVGDYALFNGTGDGNVALGANALNSSTSSQSVACGVNALFGVTGSANTAIGYQAAQNSPSGNFSNVLALGFQAGLSNTQSNRLIIGQTNLPKFTGATVADADAAAAAALPASSANGVYLYWNDVDNTIKARP